MNLLEFLAVALLALLIVLLFWFWQRSSKVRKLEQDLPSALYSMASYEPAVPLETMLSEVSACSPEPLRSAFCECVRQVRAGVSFPKALERLSRKYESSLLDRVVQLLQSAYSSGADLSEVFRKVAQDAHESQRLTAMRRQAFAVQKYTLYAGAVIVPALLGRLFSWAANSDSSFTYVSAVFWGLQVYLFYFGLFSAAFIAIVESDRRVFFPRAAVLILCGLLVFHGVRVWPV